MQFTWTPFGVMSPPVEDEFFIYAVNADGSVRKLSKKKYPNYEVVRQKCELLVGHRSIVRTSQNSKKWKEDVWFSDVTLECAATENWIGCSSYDGHETLEGISNKLNAYGPGISGPSTQVADITILQSEYDALPSESRDKIMRDAQKFAEMSDLIGSSRFLQMRGAHPHQTLALRAGIDTKGRNKLRVKITGHAYLNNFYVEFLDFNSSGLIAIGIDDRDKNDLYLATCLSVDREWRTQEPLVTGLGGKNRADLPISKYLEWYQEITKYLYLRRKGKTGVIN